MNPRRNPFTPTFGVTPPLLVGRDEVIEQFAESLDDHPGAGGRIALYTGMRGVGKTVMLNSAEEAAGDRQWVVISETASRGMVTRLMSEHLPAALRSRSRRSTKRRASGFTVPVVGGGAIWQTTELHEAAAGLRNQVEELLDLTERRTCGILFTVDEINPTHLDDLQQLCVVLQHARRRGRQIAFAGAGLPGAVEDLVALDGTTFLERADRHELGAVDLADVEDAIREPIERAGRSIEPGALANAAEATEGYPFMVQLVGATIWRQQPAHETITDADVASGVAVARRRIGQLVHGPVLKRTSDVDRSFLLAMAVDDGPSRFSDIANRLDADLNYTSQYRLRLIRAQVIREAGYGLVDFTVPYLREYLREHAASLVTEARRPR
ncbi:MAG: ATP-binding protein [Acidimicrobiales bacterium]